MTIERVYSYYTIHTDTSLCVCEYISLLRYVLSVCLDKQQMLMFCNDVVYVSMLIVAICSVWLIGALLCLHAAPLAC